MVVLGRIDGAWQALDVTAHDIDTGFNQAATRGAKAAEKAEARERRDWIKAHGPAARKRRYLATREALWTSSSLEASPNQEICKTKAPQRLSPIKQNVDQLNPYHQNLVTNSYRKKKQRSKGSTKLSGPVIGKPPIQEAPSNFQDVLQQAAFREVVLREALMDKLRSRLRKNDSEHIATCVKEPSLRRLISELHDSTVRCALSIQKFTNCFIEPQAFFYNGADYVQHMACSMDFMVNRPGLSELFTGPGPLGFLADPSLLERETNEIIREHLRDFSALRRTQICAWCGSLGGADGLSSCTDRRCDRSRYCRSCIEVNCGGVQAYKLIKVEKSWKCFSCVATELEIRKQKREAAQAHARAIVRRKRQAATDAKAAAKLERERAPENVRKRRAATRFLTEKVQAAKSTLYDQQKSLRILASQARAAKKVFQARVQALAWIRSFAKEAKGEIAAMEQLLADQEERELERQDVLLEKRDQKQKQAEAETRATQHRHKDPTLNSEGTVIDKDKNGEKLSQNNESALLDLPNSLDLHEQDQDIREEIKVQRQSIQEFEAGWLQLGVPVQLKFALRVLHFEVCLISVTSTSKNAEIVEVRTFIPSEQRFVEPSVLLHKSQVVHDVRSGPLLRLLRTRAHADYTKRASEWLRHQGAQAKGLLEHNRKQHHLREELCELASRAKEHREKQWYARQALVQRGNQIRFHLAAQGQAKKNFRCQARLIWRHLEKQGMAQDEIRKRVQQIQEHLERSRRNHLELRGRAKHVATHLQAQQFAKEQLRSRHSSYSPLQTDTDLVRRNTSTYASSEDLNETEPPPRTSDFTELTADHHKGVGLCP